MKDAAYFQKSLEAVFPGVLGIRFEEVTSERVIASMEVRPEFGNGAGVLHGGALMALADTLGAVATMTHLPEGTRTTTIESKTNFLGALRVGTRAIGECTALHRGKTTMVWQTAIKSDSGKLCALVIQTQLVLPA